MDQFVPDDLRDIIDRLSQLAVQQDLIEAAKEGCARWFQNHAEDVPYEINDIQMQLRSQSLTFRNASLLYPYIKTEIIMFACGEDIGSYERITLLDGTVDDDYFLIK